MQDEPTVTEIGLASQPVGQDGDRLTWTVRETAERLGIKTSTAYAYVESGVLPSIKLGGRLLIPCAPVLRIIEDAAGQWRGQPTAWGEKTAS